MREEHISVESAPRPRLRELAAANWDKCGLALLVLFLGLELGIGILPRTPIGPGVEELREAVQGLKGALSALPPELALRQEAVQAASTAVATLKRPAIDAPAATRVTWPEAWLEARWAGQANEIRFSAPQDFSVTSERGSCLLRWGRAATDNATSSGFRIFRAERGPENLLAELPADAREFTDRGVRAFQVYRYRVEALAREGERSLTPLSSPVVEVVGASDTRLELVGATDGEGEVKVLIEVAKWHEATWVTQRFTVRGGESIGGFDAGLGVDFTTGQTVGKITQSERREPREVQVPAFDRNARVRFQDGSAVLVARQLEVVVQVTEVLIRTPGAPDRVLKAEAER